MPKRSKLSKYWDLNPETIFLLITNPPPTPVPKITPKTVFDFEDFFKFSAKKMNRNLDENPQIPNPPNFVAIQYFFDRSKLGEF